MKNINCYLKALFDNRFAPTAFKVALIVGSILFVINHSKVLIRGKINRDRWISGLLTYLVPDSINIHSQYINSDRNYYLSQLKMNNLYFPKYSTNC